MELPNQVALAIFNVFKGQVTQVVLYLLKQNSIAIAFAPTNITHLFQPLYPTVNRHVKIYCKKKFSNWYTDQIFQELDDGQSLEEIHVKLQLTTLKPLHEQ